MYLRFIAAALLLVPAATARAEDRAIIDARAATGITGGAKIRAAYDSPQCLQGCIIDATKLQRGSDLDLDGFGPQNLIAIAKPVEIRLGEGDYRLSGSVLLRASPADCRGSQSGSTCVTGGMGLVGAGSGKTRLHFIKDPGKRADRRLVMVFAHYEPNRVPDLFAPDPADNLIAGPVILPGTSNFVVRDPARIRGLQEGTWILVGNMHRYPGNGAADFQQYEWKQIAKVKDATVWVTEPFVNTYNTIATSCRNAAQGCDRAYWITLPSLTLGTQVAGLTIVDETMSPNPTALYVSGAIEPQIRDVHSQLGPTAGPGAFALRLYRTLRPAVKGFSADGGGTRIEVAHAIDGRFSGMRTQCGAGPPPPYYFITVDFGSTANVFYGNATNCGSGFLVIEADGNTFTGNTITAEPGAAGYGARRSAGIAIYGGKDNRFYGNVLANLAVGMHLADYPEGYARIWAPKVRVKDGACVRPMNMRWLFFCTRSGGVTGSAEPDFVRTLDRSDGKLLPATDGRTIRWHFAGSVHPSTGTRFDTNTLTDVRQPISESIK